MERRLPDIARASVEKNGMLPAGAAVLAMVSGGADSTSLLRLLAAGELGRGLDLSVMHVDHMLRGESSSADATFVSELCERLGVLCRIVRYDVAAYAEAEGLNLEDAGRRVRYRFADEELDSIVCASGASEGRIATAHTLDDRVETLLMRLATGSGAGGLASIPAVRGRIVRPLIDARRSDVVAYLEAIGQQWREDSTNSDTTRLRARVRHTLLPALEAINPRFVESTARTLAILGEEDSLLGDMADGFADAFSQAMPGEVSFDRKLMLTLTRPMVRRALREALVRALPESSRLEFEHVEALVDGLAGDGFARDLPEGLRAFSEYDRMIVSRRAEEPRPAAPTVLEIPGVAVLGEAGEMTAEPADLAPIPESDLTALLDRAKVRGTLVVDGPRPGDRLRPLGMKGTRKVSDLLIDAKVPRRRRPYTPVVRDGDEVVWVAGIRMSEEYRITSETTEAVRIVWTPKDESSEGKS